MWNEIGSNEKKNSPQDPTLPTPDMGMGTVGNPDLIALGLWLGNRSMVSKKALIYISKASPSTTSSPCWEDAT
jgi:hypothetical protein